MPLPPGPHPFASFLLAVTGVAYTFMARQLGHTMGRKKDKKDTEKDKKRNRNKKPGTPVPAAPVPGQAPGGWDGLCGGENKPVAISCTHCAEAFHSKSVPLSKGCSAL